MWDPGVEGGQRCDVRMEDGGGDKDWGEHVL